MIIMIRANRMEISKWTFRRVLLACLGSWWVTPRISTQKDVVKAVRAESALLKAAAIIPMVKKIRILLPKIPDVQNMGKISSLIAGKAICSFSARINNKTPKERKRKLTGVKAKPYVYIFF